MSVWGAEFVQILCRTTCFSLRQMNYILFAGENAAEYRRHKNAQNNAKEFQTMPFRFGRNRLCTQAQEKGADCALYLQVKKDTKYLININQSINQSPVCTNAEINRGGGKILFPLQRFRYKVQVQVSIFLGLFEIKRSNSSCSSKSTRQNS